jgi:hypothetical protein
MPVKYSFILIIILIGSTSCLERYWPEVNKYDELLVVDGMLTDKQGPYQVNLSVSSGLEELQYNPLSGATMSIGDNQGNIERLHEVKNGTYETNPGFQTVPGRQYKLVVQTPDGEVYETGFQELKEAPMVDSLYAEIEIRDTRNEYQQLGGYQFYVDVNPADGKGGYYLWRMEEAYMYRSAYFIEYIFDGEMRRIFNTDTLYFCYAQGKRSEIYTYDTKNLQQKSIHKLPLAFVSNETPRLSMRYSLLLKQYFIGEDAFNYWNGIEKQRGDQGALHSKQPYQIAGNLKNINRPEEPVLGFFVVGGMWEKRIFVNPPLGVSPFIYSCAPDEEIIGYLGQIPENDYPVYFFTTESGNMASSSSACFDCTLRGGSLEKPDFWKY